MELKEGTEIKLLNGKICTIDKELGRGGQGIVYLVDYCGGDYALKWYTKDYSSDFYNNLKNNFSLQCLHSKKLGKTNFVP